MKMVYFHSVFVLGIGLIISVQSQNYKDFTAKIKKEIEFRSDNFDRSLTLQLKELIDREMTGRSLTILYDASYEGSSLLQELSTLNQDKQVTKIINSDN